MPGVNKIILSLRLTLLEHFRHILRLLPVIIGCYFFQVLASSGSAEAQVAPSNNFKVIFLKDTVSQAGNAFSFNRVSITNTSPVQKTFGLDLSVPANWQALFDSRRIFRLAPSETIELPVRVAASNSSLSQQNYSIVLHLTEAGSSQMASYAYTAQVQATSKWKAKLISPDVKLNRINKETFFQVSISNFGNTTEEITINFNTGLVLTVPKRNNRMILPAGRDTTIQIGIITDLKYLDQFKPQEINIDISSKSKSQQLLTQKIYSNNTIFRENTSRWYTAPLMVEVVSQNFANREQQLYYVNSSGNLSIGENRSLSFNFRSDNFYRQNGGSNRYSNFDYTSKNWRISLGDQTEFGNFLMDGTGARIYYKSSGPYRFQALGLQSRQGDSKQFSLEQEFLIAPNQSIINKAQASLDALLKTRSYISSLGYNFSLNDFNSVEMEAGIGYETINLPSVKQKTLGKAAGLKYYYNSPHLVLRSTSNLSSRDFPGLERGVTRTSNEVRFLRKNYFAGAIADYTSRSATVLDSNKMTLLFGGKTNEYGFRAGYSKGQSNISITTSIVTQKQDSITSPPFKSNKLNINTGWGLTRSVNLSLSTSIARSYQEQGSFHPVYGINAYGTLQSKSLGLTFRMDNGPMYYSELLSFMKTGISTNRFQLSPYAERNFFNSSLNARIEMNYAQDVIRRQEMYSARLDLNVDLKKHGLSMRFYGSKDFNQLQKFNSLNMSLRKTFIMPLPGLQKYRTLKVVLFKDRNNNNIFDQGDEAIPEASIRIQNQYFTTNIRGEALYKNISSGNYTLDLGQVNSIQGWIAKNGFRQNLSLSKSQTWYIPFQVSKFLSGKLNVVKDPFSKLEFNPANIRITAISSKGETFTTLTNAEGDFFLNLSEDTYNIRINTNVFTESFRVLKEAFDVDLLHKQKDHIIFEIRERKRQINIRN